MKALILLILMMGSTASMAQYSIKELSEGDPQNESSHLLAKNEILLVSLMGNPQAIKCSADKEQWRRRDIRREEAIEITLDDGYAYFFVQVCNTHEDVECVTYRLKGGKRYALKRDESGDAVIKAGR